MNLTVHKQWVSFIVVEYEINLTFLIEFPNIDELFKFYIKIDIAQLIFWFN